MEIKNDSKYNFRKTELVKGRESHKFRKPFLIPDTVISLLTEKIQKIHNQKKWEIDPKI